MPDAKRADRDNDTRRDTVRGQPFVQEETANQRSEHHARFAESRHRPHRAERHGNYDDPIRDQ
jgi:hypothetical protein